ncbi:hypothetical protein [Acinetobacter sp.]|jgi:hypothetical protein|uniref:hypothetical protein n=1 Tax=Acinetobacter sp. TaxID=472 RepID=UPI002823E446|nr:hypothetical protein [Acinetobacter sp.]MDR0235327.1 hypothetical protein [Acinetobacter sp.]
MKKYMILIAGILVSTHIYADSYVFGGRAHFYGVLVNQSCSISIEETARDAIKTPYSPIQVHFSLCSDSIYDNLAIGLSKQNKQNRELFFTSPHAKNDIEKENNLQNFEALRNDQKLIHHIDQTTHYDSISTTSVNIFLQPTLENVLKQSPNILISVFYP